jgi:hypothetical protein
MAVKSCYYSRIFETKGVTDKPLYKTGSSILHPYVLIPPLTEQKLLPVGSTFTFTLVLIGEYTQALPYFVYTFRQMGEKGIGKFISSNSGGERGRGNYEITAICQNGKNIWDNDKLHYEVDSFSFNKSEGQIKSITLSFLTPFRLQRNGKLVHNPNFKEIFLSALRRAELLNYYYSDIRIDDIIDIPALIKKSETIKETENSLSVYEWQRYSGRQKTKLKMDGVVGDVTYEGDLGDFVPFFRFAEIFSIGKNTVFGLGRIVIKARK